MNSFQRLPKTAILLHKRPHAGEKLRSAGNTNYSDDRWNYEKVITEEHKSWACNRTVAGNRYRIYAVEQVENSVALQDFEFETHTAYILGNEVEGVSEEALPYCEGAIELPQEGTKHSINVSVCAGIVMWTLFEKLFLEAK